VLCGGLTEITKFVCIRGQRLDTVSPISSRLVKHCLRQDHHICIPANLVVTPVSTVMV